MSNLYGFDQASTMKVITATDQAIQQMTTLIGQVNRVAAEAPIVNRSASGQRLGQEATFWADKFTKVKNEITELHGRATRMMQENVGTNEAATGAVPGSN